RERAAAEASATTAPAPFARWLLPTFAVSGLVAILYQIAWTRVLSILFGGIVYAFAAILAIYLFGLALGWASSAPSARRTRAPAALFGWLQALLGAAVALGLHALGPLPHWEATAIGGAGDSVTSLLLRECGITAIVLLPATVILGALFPVAVAIQRSVDVDVAAATGAVYAANTVGSIAGSLVTALVLVPAIGAAAAIVGAAAARLA